MHSFYYRNGKLFCEGMSVQALAEKHGTPLYIYSQQTLADHFQKLDGALRPIDNKLEQMPRLCALDAAGSAFGHQFARHHKADTIALLGFFQIVSSYQDGCAEIGQSADDLPERAARQRIDA